MRNQFIDDAHWNVINELIRNGFGLSWQLMLIDRMTCRIYVWKVRDATGDLMLTFGKPRAT